jgi:hypothetical protein
MRHARISGRCPDNPDSRGHHRWNCQCWSSEKDRCFHCGLERRCAHYVGGRLFRHVLREQNERGARGD